MQGALKRGLGKTIAGSFIIHLLVIILGLFLYKAGPGRSFFAPVYTVSIVSGGGPGPAGRVEMKEAAPQPKPSVPEKTYGNKTADVKTHTPKAALKNSAGHAAAVKIPDKRTKARDKTINEALKRIEKDVKEKQDEEVVSSGIENIKKKRESESSAIEDRIGQIKKELESDSAASPRASPGPGGAQGAVTRANIETKYRAYFSTIHDMVQDKWIYPTGLKSNNISVIISIKIGKDGKLLDSWLEKSSGNAIFDQSLLDAIKKAAPFPHLPQDFDGDVLETGFRFCPGGCPG